MGKILLPALQFRKISGIMNHFHHHGKYLSASHPLHLLSAPQSPVIHQYRRKQYSTQKTGAKYQIYFSLPRMTCRTCARASAYPFSFQDTFPILFKLSQKQCPVNTKIPITARETVLISQTSQPFLHIPCGVRHHPFTDRKSILNDFRIQFQLLYRTDSSGETASVVYIKRNDSLS